MKSTTDIPSLRLSRAEPMAAKGIFATFAAATRLRSNAYAGMAIRPLRGKNLALLLGPSPAAGISTLRRAAHDLGARVAEVRFLEEHDDVTALARMLGRMYDAVDCEALMPATASEIQQEAGVPVCRDLSLDEHPARVLADLMTLHELHSPPGASILFLGDPRAARARRFISAARETGFDVILGAGTEAVPTDETTFQVDARRAPHWALAASGQSLDEARRAENHRFVMQAILLETIVKA